MLPLVWKLGGLSRAIPEVSICCLCLLYWLWDQQQASVTWTNHLASVTPGRRLARCYHWAMLWSSRWEQNEVMPLVFQISSLQAPNRAHLQHPALSQIPIPAKQLWSWNPPWKTTEINSSWRRNFILWQTERFGQTAEPSSVQWWVMKIWLNQSDLAGTGKLPVGPNRSLSGINWVQQAPVSARQMHPVVAALTVGRRLGSVKIRGWEMHHIITDSNSWKKDLWIEKFGVEKEK